MHLQFREACVDLVEALPWAREVEVAMTAQAPKNAFEAPSGLSQVTP